MNIASGRAALLVALSAGIAACGGDSTTDAEAPVNIDYSTLKVAASQEDPLTPAIRDEEVLEPLRNGVRMSISNGLIYTTGVATPAGDSQGNYSGTTVQVDGVDEADLVKYDGRYIYTVRPEVVPASSILPAPGLTRNVLKIVRTDPATAGTEVISEFDIEGEQTQLPQIYRLQADTDDGATRYLATVSTNSWLYATFLAGHVPPNRTTVQLLDVRDPRAVSQAWKIEMDGWLQSSRKIGDTLYLVTSYWPELSGLTLPADSIEKREANERRIRGSGANELLPGYSENGGAPRQLAKPGDCFIAAGAASNDANRELTVITALSLSERRIKDAAKTRPGLRWCSSCKTKFTVTIGTIFEDSHIPLRTWLIAWYLLCSSKKGISSLQLQRILDIGSYRTALFMAHRIRHALKHESYNDKLSGIVEADECAVPVGANEPEAKRPRKHARVFSMVERKENGRVRSKVLKTVSGDNLKQVIRDNVQTASELHTDMHPGYTELKHDYYHHWIKHRANEFKRIEGQTIVTTASVESFFSLLRRGLIGTFHHVSEQHLPLYVAEFDHRHNFRKTSDGKRTNAGLEMAVGKRLVYKIK